LSVAGAADIGQATAILFAAEGAKVVVADLDEAAGAVTIGQINKAQGGQAIFVPTDASQESDDEPLCR